MNPLRGATRAATLAAALLFAVGATSCSEKIRSLVIPNQLPEVRITSAPIDTNATCTPDPVRSCYALTINWVGYDADGRVDRYLYAVDPPGEANADTAWQVTEQNEVRIVLSSSLPDDPADPGRIFEEPHVFVLKAIDNRGAAGPVIHRSFFSFTEAPTVLIENPRPSELLTPLVPPSVRITWSGNDRDGVFTSKPVRYRYILLGPGSAIKPNDVVTNRDTLRTVYAPDFEGWEESSAETTDVQYTNLTPNETYMFVVVAFDEAGAYSPVFSMVENMLRFKVGFAGTQGPKICFFNEYFNYCYTTGGYCADCPEIEVIVEVPSETEVTINWYADPPPGATIKSYRWALDIAAVSDSTPRENEQDYAHWSTPSLNVTSVRLGPWPGGEEHRFFLEAEDNNGLRSLGVVRFVVVESTLELPLLIVDDTRFLPDNRTNPTAACVDRPRATAVWPMAAELDTFLFAVGGVPWRCYPDGSMSTPGIFAGYPFDTLGTRYQRNDMTTRLADIGRYAHVIWILDYDAASKTNPGTNRSDPITSLRYMSDRSRVNTLGAYISQGGKVWMLGSGVALATNLPWNDRNNDAGGAYRFRSSGSGRELAPGRFMFDVAHWQTDIEIKRANATVHKFLGRYRDRSDPANPWTLHKDELIATLQQRDVAPADPPPSPVRTASQFTITSLAVEYLFSENIIIEDVDPDPERFDEQSTLDTLLYVVGSGLPTEADPNYRLPVMTYYHGPSMDQGFLFTGFAPWHFKRAHQVALVDFVLQKMWSFAPRSASHLRAAHATEGASASRGTASLPSPGWSNRLGRGLAARPGAVTGSRRP